MMRESVICILHISKRVFDFYFCLVIVIRIHQNYRLGVCVGDEVSFIKNDFWIAV